MFPFMFLGLSAFIFALWIFIVIAHLGQEENWTTEDEMVGWCHWFNGYEFEQALGVGDEQGRLVCYSLWGCKESGMTNWLNWTDCT